MPAARLEEAVSHAATETGGLVAVYLFGSEADDRTHRQSDVDLGILFDRLTYPTAPARFEARLRFAARIASALRRDDVDLVILNDAPPQLGRHIVTRGQRLYCSNHDITHAFVRTTLLRAADLEPFLQRARRVKLQAIAR